MVILDTNHISVLERRGAGAYPLLVRLAEIPASDVWVIEQSHASFADGLELYNGRPDKAYSLVDCISMIACRMAGITEVLTHDHHFTRAAPAKAGAATGFYRVSILDMNYLRRRMA